MTDYVKTTEFGVKDALTTGDPNKTILGASFDVEFDDIATAVATKYDVDSVGSQAQAEAGTSNDVLMTPGRVTNWAQYNSGSVADLQALADPGADRIPFWDESANALVWGTAATGLTITTTTISVDHDAATNFVADEHVAHSGVTLTAGDGIDGGGDISASRSFAVDSTVLRTTGNFTIAGTIAATGAWTFTSAPLIGAAVVATTADIADAGVFAGYVGANGTTGNNLPAGWSAVRDSVGVYTITHNLGLAAGVDLAVAITPICSDDRWGNKRAAPGVNSFSVGIIDAGSGAADNAFTFIAKEI